MKAIRIRDREVLASPLVQELFVKAFKRQVEYEASEVWDWCMEAIEDDNTAVIVVRDDDLSLVGLAICAWYPGPWSPAPWVLDLYAGKADGIFEALLAEIRVWGLGLGQERLWFIDSFGHTLTEDQISRLKPRDESVEKYGPLAQKGTLYEQVWKKEE